MGAIRADGTMSVRIIRPGWGSSGFYSPEVLKRDGPKVFTKNTKVYVDHPTPTEEADRPERSVRDLAAELTSDARWEPDHRGGPGLYAEAKVFKQFQPLVEELADHIGLSIRAMGKAKAGKAEGRTGPIIEEISAARSVDLVTQPGAGGGILQLFEARRSAAQTPQGEANTQQGDEDMGEIEALKESNAQLEKKLAEQANQLARMQEGLMLREAGEYATGKLASADLPTVTKARLARELVKATPIKEGKLDLTAFDTQITEAVKAETAYLVEVTGGGKIAGMGSSTEVEPKPEEALATMKESYMAMGYSDASATAMAKGRA